MQSTARPHSKDASVRFYPGREGSSGTKNPTCHKQQNGNREENLSRAGSSWQDVCIVQCQSNCYHDQCPSAGQLSDHKEGHLQKGRGCRAEGPITRGPKLRTRLINLVLTSPPGSSWVCKAFSEKGNKGAKLTHQALCQCIPGLQVHVTGLHTHAHTHPLPATPPKRLISEV